MSYLLPMRPRRFGVIRVKMFPRLLAVLCLTAWPAGCARSFDAETMRQMRPTKSPQLNHLSCFAGQWETRAENKIICLGQTFDVRGTTDNTWESDGWYLVERGQYEMGELGTVHEIGIWTWDDEANCYRTWRFDSFGGTRLGTATFDESTRTWTLKATRRSSWGNTIDRGTIRVVDDRTLEWKWEEWSTWDPLRLFKMFEFSGTSTKK